LILICLITILTSVSYSLHVILSNNIGFYLVSYHVIAYLIWKLLKNVFCKLNQICCTLVTNNIFFNFNKLDDISGGLLT
jgi:hypothetical protein